MFDNTPEDPIKVIGNQIRDGGSSKSGAEIMCGDKGGSYILVEDNILADPGKYGITISSGNHITIKNNKIFGMKQLYSNIVFSTSNQYPIEYSSNTNMNNQVNFTNKNGKLNCLWNAENCGIIKGWNTNYYNVNLKLTTLPIKINGSSHENSANKISTANK